MSSFRSGRLLAQSASREGSRTAGPDALRQEGGRLCRASVIPKGRAFQRPEEPLFSLKQSRASELQHVQ
jgi:hypothetical protein